MEIKHTHKVSRVAGAVMMSAALIPLETQAQELSIKEIAKMEIERRRAQVGSVDDLIKEARENYSKARYAKAVDLYRQALGLLPEGRMLDERRKVYTKGLAQASGELAKQKIREGDVQGARVTYGEVRKLDPSNMDAEVGIDRTFDPIRVNPSLTKEHGAKVDQVRRLLYQGEGFFNSGRFKRALEEFDKVLRIDPTNTAARRWQTRTHNELSKYYDAAYDETRARLLADVAAAWEIVPVPTVSDTQFQGGRSIGVVEQPGTIKINRKLDNIIIPSFDVEDATLTSAIAQLEIKTRDLDPVTEVSEKGISFVIRRPKNAGDSEGEAIEDNEIRISKLSLKNVPAKEVLKQICLQCNPLMRYKIEEYVVAVIPATEGGDSDTFTRQFNVPPDFKERIGAINKNDGGDGGGIFDPEPDAGADAPPSLKEVFESLGVTFPGNSNVVFIESTSTLTVTNTVVGLDKIDRIIADIINNVPKQISITTKFVEINQQDNDELGFDWVVSPFGLTGNGMFLGGGTIGNGVSRNATNFNSPVDSVAIPGIPLSGDVFNTPTSGLRSGDTAITRDSINFFLNNPTRTAQSASVAPGILSVTGLFSDGQVQMIMRGLAQKKGTDVMNAPTVLSRSGEEARIEVVREFIYPTEYDPPEIPDSIGDNGNNNNGGGGLGNPGNTFQVIPITPATPTAFESRPTGVILEILPKLGSDQDNRTINLSLSPEIVEFEGFINYGSPIQAVGVDALGNPVQITVTENRIEMPVFSKRQVRTGLTIFDGHTVAIGGLMSEEVQKVEDKVPVLGDIPLIGRLFQSSAENRLKSNLVIFVTANIIDATGRKLYEERSDPVNSNFSGDIGSTGIAVP